MRDQYGALFATSTAPLFPILQSALDMAAQAAAKGRLPAAFDSMEWKRINSRVGNKRVGEALHHEIYDVTPDGRRAMVCCRSVEGDRYGIKTTGKEYFILARHGAGVRVTQANKAVAAKAAKQAGEELGLALAITEGKAKLVVGGMAKRSGYKLVRVADDGALVSAWDGSPWTLDVARTEKASDDHSGGFYYYRTLAQCLEAASRNETFGQARDHHRLVVVEVEASGCEYELGRNKLCATRIRPLRVVCSTL